MLRVHEPLRSPDGSATVPLSRYDNSRPPLWLGATPFSHLPFILGAGGMIVTKRAYEPASASDGYRVMIDRLWPRGVSKAKARLEAWEKDIAPSRGLREWYGHDPAKWPEFRRRYTRELRASPAKTVLDDLARRAKKGRVTLVFASKAADISDVAVLERLLNRRLRSPLDPLPLDSAASPRPGRAHRA